MPIISFDRAALLATTVIKEQGFYKAAITEIEAKLSNAQKSMNYWFVFKLSGDHKYSGKEIRACFNSEMDNESILGNLQLFPATKMCEIQAILTGETINYDGMQVDTDNFLGREIGIGIATKANEAGGLMNIISGFISADRVDQMKAPF